MANGSKAMQRALEAVKKIGSERIYIGDNIWMRTYSDGSKEYDIYFTEAEDAELRADASAAGVTVEQLLMNRLFGKPDYFEDVTIQ